MWVVDAAWGWVYDQGSPFHAFVTLTLVIHMAVFWPLTLALMGLDITQAPAFLYKYKIQRVGVSVECFEASLTL